MLILILILIIRQEYDKKHFIQLHSICKLIFKIEKIFLHKVDIRLNICNVIDMIKILLKKFRI